jgi:type I restriction enzyme R subunit
VTRQETPEKLARRLIDAALDAAGWAVQDRSAVNLRAGSGVAVREFQLRTGHGYADYLLYADQQAVGVIEAKKQGTTLTGVEIQAEKYAAGMPEGLPAPCKLLVRGPRPCFVRGLNVSAGPSARRCSGGCQH